MSLPRNANMKATTSQIPSVAMYDKRRRWCAQCKICRNSFRVLFRVQKKYDNQVIRPRLGPPPGPSLSRLS